MVLLRGEAGAPRTAIAANPADHLPHVRLTADPPIRRLGRPSCWTGWSAERTISSGDHTRPGL